MVKGISRQVIVVHAPDPKLFEQAIFILRENAPGITDEALLKEAERIVREPDLGGRRRHLYLYGFFWASLGALAMGAIWCGVWLLPYVI